MNRTTMTPADSLAESEVAQSAALLLRARAHRVRLPDWPTALRPYHQHDAERICEAMAQGLERPITGWKVGALDPAIAVKRGLERPFCGQVPQTFILPSGADVPWHDLLRPVVEAEIVVRLACDLPARDRPYTMEEVAAAVDAVIPAIEIPESRLVDGHPLGALGMVADQGFAGRLVLGTPVTSWRDLDLAGCRVSLRIGSGAAVQGSGERAMGHPLRAVHWLANYRRELGDGLRRAQVVSTGSLTGVQPTAAGDRVIARFDELGEVALRMV